MEKGGFTIIVDGKEVLCNEDDTYLTAIRRAGITIPTLCHIDELKPSGSCRMCVVEVEGVPNLVASCATPVVPNAVVHTSSDRVIKARQTLIELILRSHPLNCIVCHQNGRCVLQTLAYQYLPKERLQYFEGKMPTTDLQEENQFFVLNYDACIRCQLCARVVDEIQLCGVISMQNRGFNIYPSAGFGRSFQEAGCVACGNCVEVCPVGALVNKPVIESPKRLSELDTVVTTCGYCGVGCQMEVLVDRQQNRIIDVQSHRANVVNGLALCVKGRYGWNFVHHKDRLTTPLIKKDGKFVKATWDEALDLIVNKLRETKEKHGPDSIAFLASAKCTNEENYLMQKLARAVIGTNNVDHCARLCHASTICGLVRAFGSGAMTNSIEDLTNDAKVIFVIGSNTTEAHPVIGNKIKRAVKEGKTRLIVADPRRIELADYAEVYIQQKPGSDVALINAMLKVILEEELYDKKFIAQRTENFEELQEYLSQIPLDTLCKIADVEIEDVRNAARLYAKAETAAIVYSMGITQHITGTDNVLSLANLAMITGNVGKPGTGVNPLRGQNNVQGACDMAALPEFLPGYKRVSDDEARKTFESYWNTKLNANPGLTILELFHGIEDGTIKMMYIMGENPALSDPNGNFVRKALEQLDFLVVQDLFLTETAQYADVVLPGASFAEKEGTFTNTERRVQRVRKAIEPIGEALPDWKILSMIMEKLGYPAPYDSPEDIMKEINQFVPLYGGITYERIENVGLQWPCPTTEHQGTKILHTEKFSRGKGRFHAVKYLDPAEIPDEEYPIILTTGRSLYHFHTGEMTHRDARLHSRRPLELTEINPLDAERLGITDGDTMTIESRRGKITTIAHVTEKVKPGVVFMTFHHKEAPANILTNDAYDPHAKIPELKVCAVKITKN